MIPILDLTRQHQELKPEFDRAFSSVMKNGTFINGPNVEQFERELAQYLGTNHAVGLNSGTDALHLALRALGIGAGDEVITTPFTFIATTEAIGIVGATPVFVDIDPRTLNLDVNQIEAAITPRTRAILPVHLYGMPAQMDAIVAIAARHQLAVIEDCAQSIGASIGRRMTGTFGNIGCFSFFPSKNLGACGDAGAIVTNDPALAARVKRLRAHGAAVKYHHEELGVNSRLDEIQAALLRIKLRHLERWIERRRTIAAWYTVELGKIGDVEVPPFDPNGDEAYRHVYHQYTVRVRRGRDRVAEALRERGIQTMIYYPVPLHLQKVHAALKHEHGDFPKSEAAADRVLSLPMFPELRDVELDAVVSGLKEVLAPALPSFIEA